MEKSSICWVVPDREFHQGRFFCMDIDIGITITHGFN